MQSVVNFLRKTAECIYENEFRQNTSSEHFGCLSNHRSHAGDLEMLQHSMAKRVRGALIWLEIILGICNEVRLGKQ